MADILGQAGELNIVIEQGATWEYPFTWTSGDDPVDLTGCQIKAQIRKKAATSTTEPPVIINLNTPDEITITDAANGVFVITIDADTTSEMPDGNYKWDLFVKFPGGIVRKLWAGDVEFVPNVTEPSTGA